MRDENEIHHWRALVLTINHISVRAAITGGLRRLRNRSQNCMSTSLASSLAAHPTPCRRASDVKIAAGALHRTNQLNFRCGRRALIKAKKAPPRYQRAKPEECNVVWSIGVSLSLCIEFIMHQNTKLTIREHGVWA
jgi:hypothetical protein